MDHRVKTKPEYMFFNTSCHVRSDVREWLEKQIGRAGYYSSKRGWVGRWIATGMGNHCVFRFKKSSDAMLFKLTWGGA